MNQPRKSKKKFKPFSVKINAEFYFVIKIIAELKRISISQVITESFFNTFQPHYIFINAWQYQDVVQQVSDIEICLGRLNHSIHTIRHFFNKYEKARTDVPYSESDAYNKAIRTLNMCQANIKDASADFDTFYQIFANRFYLSSSLGSRKIPPNIKRRVKHLVIKSNQLRKLAPVEQPRIIHTRIPSVLYNLIHKYRNQYHSEYKYIIEQAIMSIHHLPRVIIPIEDMAHPSVYENLSKKDLQEQWLFESFYVQLDQVLRLSNKISSIHMNFLNGMSKYFTAYNKHVLHQKDSSAYFNQATKVENAISNKVISLCAKLDQLTTSSRNLK